MKWYQIINNKICGNVEYPPIDENNNILPEYKLLDENEVNLYKYSKYDELNNLIIEDTEELNNQKLIKLKKIRNELINNTIWIMQRHQGELEGLSKNITTKPTTLTELEYNTWLLYWQDLRDLPQTVNLENIDINNIESVFPTMPEIK